MCSRRSSISRKHISIRMRLSLTRQPGDRQDVRHPGTTTPYTKLIAVYSDSKASSLCLEMREMREMRDRRNSHTNRRQPVRAKHS